MSIRTFPILLSLASCAPSAAPDERASESATAQPSAPDPRATTCEHIRHPCDPSNASSGSECVWACGVSSHCKEYTPQEIVFCERHPDYFIDPTHYCDVWGNPMWDTWCVVDFVSSPPSGP